MEDLSRPPGSGSHSERVRSWVEWFGLGRLVGAAVATIAICVGAFWLVRNPPPATEAALPRSSASTTASGTEPTDGAGPATTMPANLDVAAPREPVTIHVAGAVVEPGVYELGPGARTLAAIEAAGGATAEADAGALNLAAPLIDGSRVYVPEIGESVPPPVEPGAATGGGESVTPVDVNRATVDQLEALPGVGPATAAAIVTERERNGPFLGVDDLERVPGIGPAKLAALREFATT